MRRSGRINIIGILLTLTLAVAALGAYLFVPPYVVYYKMQNITKTLVLEWAGLNEDAGHRRLPVELHTQEIPSYITIDMCQFKTDGNNKIVTCDWDIDVYYPFTDYYKTLTFETYAMHDGVNVITD